MFDLHLVLMGCRRWHCCCCCCYFLGRRRRRCCCRPMAPIWKLLNDSSCPLFYLELLWWPLSQTMQTDTLSRSHRAFGALINRRRCRRRRGISHERERAGARTSGDENERANERTNARAQARTSAVDNGSRRQSLYLTA